MTTPAHIIEATIVVNGSRSARRANADKAELRAFAGSETVVRATLLDAAGEPYGLPTGCDWWLAFDADLAPTTQPIARAWANRFNHSNDWPDANPATGRVCARLSLDTPAAWSAVGTGTQVPAFMTLWARPPGGAPSLLWHEDRMRLHNVVTMPEAIPDEASSVSSDPSSWSSPSSSMSSESSMSSSWSSSQSSQSSWSRSSHQSSSSESPGLSSESSSLGHSEVGGSSQSSESSQSTWGGSSSSQTVFDQSSESSSQSGAPLAMIVSATGTVGAGLAGRYVWTTPPGGCGDDNFVGKAAYYHEDDVATSPSNWRALHDQYFAGFWTLSTLGVEHYSHATDVMAYADPTSATWTFYAGFDSLTVTPE